jgi:heme exporter protein D
MKWTNLSEFLAMGGYGLYVWGSYAVCVLLMVVEPWLARHRHRQALNDAATQTEGNPR